MRCSVKCGEPTFFPQGAHFLFEDLKSFRINISLLTVSPSLPEVISLLLLYISLFPVVFEGGGHRKITIIIEDPVAGWQCSSTVLHHYTPLPTPFSFHLCMLMNSFHSFSFQVLPPAPYMCFCCWMFKKTVLVCQMSHSSVVLVVYAHIFHDHSVFCWNYHASSIQTVFKRDHFITHYSCASRYNWCTAIVI